MKGSPGIKEFPSDNRYWRVEWFGAVQLNPRLAREPAPQVIIPPLKRLVAKRSSKLSLL